MLDLINKLNDGCEYLVAELVDVLDSMKCAHKLRALVELCMSTNPAAVAVAARFIYRQGHELSLEDDELEILNPRSLNICSVLLSSEQAEKIGLLLATYKQKEEMYPFLESDVVRETYDIALLQKLQRLFGDNLTLDVFQDVKSSLAGLIAQLRAGDHLRLVRPSRTSSEVRVTLFRNDVALETLVVYNATFASRLWKGVEEVRPHIHIDVTE